MKKLLDETTDELTRSLLDAGRTHRPPAGNQARLLLALGVGSSIGLLSSKAFAWLGSSAGKLTLVSVGVLGIAGAAYSFAPRPNAGDSSGRALSGRASSDTVEARAALTPQLPAADVALAAQRSAPQPAEPQAVFVPAPAADVPQSERSSGVAPRVARASRRAHAPAAERNERRLSRAERRSAARRVDAVALRAAASESASESTEASQPSAPSASTLKSEVALVDAMRGAAARRDGEALRRLIANYRGSFPEGQLRQEVSELALHPLATAR
jgi:hypothetical protein